MKTPDQFPSYLNVDSCDACKTIVIYDCIKHFSSQLSGGESFEKQVRLLLLTLLL